MSNRVVLVDTSVWILALRKSPLAPVRDEVDHLLAENRVAIVPMIRLELLGGIKSANEFERLKGRLDALRQIPADEANWEIAAELSFLHHIAGTRRDLATEVYESPFDSLSIRSRYSLSLPIRLSLPLSSIVFGMAMLKADSISSMSYTTAIPLF